MRILPIRRDTYEINKKVGFDHLEKNEITGVVDTVNYREFSRPGHNLRKGEYIYIPEYNTIPVYGIVYGIHNDKIKWFRIESPRKSKLTTNFLKNSLLDPQGQTGQQGGYRNKEETRDERINCEKLKEFLNNG